MRLGNFSISLAVNDIHASLAFYEKLGFRPVGGDIAQNWVVLQNATTKIGLFQGMFEKNMLTFNPGWDHQRQTPSDFDDVRDLQKSLKSQGVTLLVEADETSTGVSALYAAGPRRQPDPGRSARAKALEIGENGRQLASGISGRIAGTFDSAGRTTLECESGSKVSRNARTRDRCCQVSSRNAYSKPRPRRHAAAPPPPGSAPTHRGRKTCMRKANAFAVVRSCGQPKSIQSRTVRVARWYLGSTAMCRANRPRVAIWFASADINVAASSML